MGNIERKQVFQPLIDDQSKAKGFERDFGKSWRDPVLPDKRIRALEEYARDIESIAKGLPLVYSELDYSQKCAQQEEGFMEDTQREMCVGYTSSENKLNHLKNRDFQKQFILEDWQQVSTIQMSVAQTDLILLGCLYAKSQGGLSADQNYAQWLQASDVNGDTTTRVLQTSMLIKPYDSVPLDSPQDRQRAKTQLQRLHVSLKDSMSDQDDNSFALGMLKDLGESVLAHPQSDSESRKLALSLLIRLLSAYPELSLAYSIAFYSLKHRIEATQDISKMLETGTQGQEVFEKEEDEDDDDNQDFQGTKIDLIKDHISFGDDPKTSQLSMMWDAWAIDDAHIYNYNAQRGLTKAKKESDGSWGAVVGFNRDVAGFKGVSMVVVHKKLLLRHKGLTDRPVAVYDCETLRLAAPEDQLQSSEEADKPTLDWGCKALPGQASLVRHMGATPLAFDGRFLYAMSTERDSDRPNCISSTKLEVYEVRGKVIGFVRSCFFNEHDRQKKFQKAYKLTKTYQSNEGPLDFATLSTNGKFLILSWPRLIYIFNLRTGKKLASEKFTDFEDIKQEFILAYDRKEHRLSSFQTGVMNGQQRQLRMANFKKSKVEKVLQRVPPRVLDQVKKALQAEITENQSTLKPIPRVDLTQARFRNSLSSSYGPAIAQLEENMANQLASTVPCAVEAQAAIILSRDAFLLDTELESVDGKFSELSFDEIEQMQKLYPKMIPRESAFIKCKELLRELALRLSLADGCQAKYIRVSLLATIKMANYSLMTLNVYKMALSDLLEPADLQDFKDLNSTVVRELAFKHGRDDGSEESRYSRVIAWHAKELYERLSRLADSGSPFEKVDSFLAELKRSGSVLDKDSQGSGQLKQLLDALNSPKLIRQMLKGSSEQLKQACEALKLLIQLTSAQESSNVLSLDKDFNQDNGSLLFKAASFMQTFCEQLLINFGLLIQEVTTVTKELKSVHDSEKRNELDLHLKETQRTLKTVEPLVYEVFEALAEEFKLFLTRVVEQATPRLVKLGDIMDYCTKCSLKLETLFKEKNSVLSLTYLFCHALQLIPIGVCWLDEVAAGLKHALQGLTAYRLFVKSATAPELAQTLKTNDKFLPLAEQISERVCYTLGSVATRLIATDRSKEETSGQDERVFEMLSKLPVIKGGIENRFIPCFEQKTKSLIEGFFKITADSELRRLSFLSIDQVKLTDEDKLLSEIIDPRASDEREDLESMLEDFSQLTLSVLQQGLLSKVPTLPYARVGGERGLLLTKAAFAATLKLSDNVQTYRKLTEDVEVAVMQLEDDQVTGDQRARLVFQTLKKEDSKELKQMLGRWQQACEVRRWLKEQQSSRVTTIFENEKKNFLSEAQEAQDRELNAEEDEVVQERTHKLLEKEISELVSDTVEKARFLLKLRVPDVFRQARKEEQAAQVRRQLSLQKTASQMGRQRSQAVDEEPSLNKTESVFEQTQRIQQWQQAQLNQSSVTEFASNGLTTSMSCSLMVLQCLKAEYRSRDLKDFIEEQMVGGLRRAAGLNLLSFAMHLNLTQKSYLLLLNWFQRSLRSDFTSVPHYMSKFEGCGQHVHGIARTQFFSILATVVLALKTASNNYEICFVMNALYWDYSSEDLVELTRLGVFQALQEGNGERLNPLRQAWGHIVHISKGHKDPDHCLPSKLISIFNFLFKAIMRSIVSEDLAFVGESQDLFSRSSSVVAQKNAKSGMVRSAETVLQQVFEVLFGNVSRYLDVLDRFPDGVSQLQGDHEDGFNESQTLKDLLLDDLDFVDTLGGFKKAQRDAYANYLLRRHKLDAVVHRLVSERREGSSSEFTEKVERLGTEAHFDTTSGSFCGQLIERTLTAAVALRAITFEQLQIPEPTNEEVLDIFKAKELSNVDQKPETKQEEQAAPLATEEEKVLKQKQVSNQQKVRKLEQIWQRVQSILSSGSTPQAHKNAVYSKFAHAFPAQWLESLQQEHLSPFWTQGQTDNQEFLAQSECCGVNQTQVCVVTGNQEEFKEAVGLEFAMSRETRNTLCYHCFWYCVLQNVLKSRQRQAKRHMKALVKYLPSQLPIFVLSVNDLVASWLQGIEGQNVDKDQGQGDKTKAKVTDDALMFPSYPSKLKFSQIKKNVEWLTDLLGPDGGSDSSDSTEAQGSDCEEVVDLKKIPWEHKRFIWRHLASFFPLKWCINFEREEFVRWRIENEQADSSDSVSLVRDDSVPFASVAECLGPVKNMFCLSSSRNDALNQASIGDDERMARAVLCRDCYWFMSSINVIMQTDNNGLSSGSSDGSFGSVQQINMYLKRFLKQLPNSYQLFNDDISTRKFWKRQFKIFDNLRALKELAEKIIERLGSSSSDSLELRAKVYRSFADDFTDSWLSQLDSLSFRQFFVARDQSAEPAESAQAQQSGCPGIKKGFVCVDSANGEFLALNEALCGESLEARACSKCQRVYALLLLLSSEKPEGSALIADEGQRKNLQETRDSRASREAFNKVIQSVPQATTQGIKYSAESLLSRWSDTAAVTALEPNRYAKVRVKGSEKIKLMSRFVKIYYDEMLIVLKPDGSQGSLADHSNPILQWVVEKINSADMVSLQTITQKFFASLPVQFVDEAIACGSENGKQDQMSFKPQDECYGFCLGFVCAQNEASDMFEKNRELGFPWDIDLQGSNIEVPFCRACFRNYSLLELLEDRECHEKLQKVFDTLSDDHPLFTLGPMYYLVNNLTYENGESHRRQKAGASQSRSPSRQSRSDSRSSSRSSSGSGRIRSSCTSKDPSVCRRRNSLASAIEGAALEIRSQRRSMSQAGSVKSLALSDKISQEVETERNKIEGLDVTQTLKDLQQLQPQAKQNVASVNNLYHESFLMRILEMLDFFSSLAQSSPATLALIQKFIEPRHLQHLLKLMTCGLPRTKTIAVRVFSQLLERCIPHEVLNQAVRESCAQNADMQRVLSHSSQIEFSEAPFFQFVFNLVLQNKEHVWNGQVAQMKGSHAFVCELASLFDAVLQGPASTDQTGQKVRAVISEALKRVQDLSEVEIETLMSILPHSRFNSLQKGSLVLNSSGQKMTVLGYASTSREENMNDAVRLASEISPSNELRHMYGLYFNENAPERQEIISVPKQEYQALKALSTAEARSLALNSPFCDMALAAHFIELLRSDSESFPELSQFKAILLKNYLLRGFSSVIAELKQEYVSMLSEAGLSQHLISVLLSTAGQGFDQGASQVLASQGALELRCDLIKQHLLCSDKSLTELDRSSAEMWVDVDEAHFLLRVRRAGDKKTMHTFELGSKNFVHDDCTQWSDVQGLSVKLMDEVNLQSHQDQGVVVFTPEDLESLSDVVLATMSKAQFVMTSNDDFNLSQFLQRLRIHILKTNKHPKAARCQYFVLPGDEFTRVKHVLQASFEKNLAYMSVESDTVLDTQRAQFLALWAQVEATQVQFNLIDFIRGIPREATASEQGPKASVISLLRNQLDSKSRFYDEQLEVIQEMESSEKVFTTELARVMEALLAIQERYQHKEEQEKLQEGPFEQCSGPVHFASLIEESIELGNFVLTNFESTQVAPSNEHLSSIQQQEKFCESIELPHQDTDLKRVLHSNLRTLNTFTGQTAFQSLFAFMESSHVVGQAEMQSKLCTSIYSQMTLAMRQKSEQGVKAPLKTTKANTRALLQSLLAKESFGEYLLKDLESRAMLTLKAVTEDEDFDLMELTAKNQRALVKQKHALDPLVIRFFVKELLKEHGSEIGADPRICLRLFDLLLSQVVLFSGDPDTHIVAKLLETCSSIFEVLLNNINAFAEQEPGLIESFVQNRILQTLSAGLNLEREEQDGRKRYLLNLLVAVFTLHEQALRERLTSCSLAFELSLDKLSQAKNQVFRDGRTFTFLRSQMIKKHLVADESTSSQIASSRKTYASADKRFDNEWEVAIKSETSNLKVKYFFSNLDAQRDLVATCDGEPIPSFHHGQGALLLRNNSVLRFKYTRQNSKPEAMVPGEPYEPGVVHAWKIGDSESQFVSPSSLQAKADSLPPLCVAVRHNIKDFASKKDQLFEPIQTLMSENSAYAQIECEPFKSSLSGDEIPLGEPLYFSHSSVNDKVQKVYLSQAEVLVDDRPFDLNPLIFYRVAPGYHSLVQELPLLDLKAFYAQYEYHSELKFTVQEFSLGASEESNEKLVALLGPDKRDHFSKLSQFTKAMDDELLKQMDKFGPKVSDGREVSSLSLDDFQISKFVLSDELFRDVPREVVGLRTELFLKFAQKFWKNKDRFRFIADNQAQPNQGTSLNQYVQACKHLLFPYLKNTLLDHHINYLSTGYTSSVYCSRRKALIFADSGQVDHEGNRTIFGQIMQGVKKQNNGFINFRQRGTDNRCWKVNFHGEGSMDYGGPFRDSLVNINSELESGALPLLIKSPNNHSEVGTFRECFLLNPEADSPTHLEMFHFLGCIIGFGIMSKSPIPLNLAPSVWKQLLGESLSLADLEDIDTLSAKTLRDLLAYSCSLSDTDFSAAMGGQTFTTVLSHGQEVPLGSTGFQRILTKDNVQEFVKLSLKARENECEVQIRELRRGVATVLDDLTALSLMEWNQIEVRACGEKTLDIERLKSITSYPRCPQSHASIRMFWRVFEERFTEEERQLYLKFVWGRTRLPMDLSNLNNRHEIRLMNNLSSNGFPISHTCFFQLDLPPYKDEEVCYKKLLGAITMCGSVDIDTDNIGNESD